MQKPTVVELSCEKRETGRKEADRLRSNLLIPAVIYGPKVEDNIHIAVPELALEKILSKTTTQVVKLTVDGTTYETLVKKVEFHPVTDKPLNVDFYALSEDHEVTITVPIRLMGTARGLTEGGRLFQPLRKIRVRCSKDNLPAELTLDITKLKIGDTLKVAKLETEGLTPLMEEGRTVVVIRPPKGGLKALLGLDDEDEDGDEESAEGGEATEATAEEENAG